MYVIYPADEVVYLTYGIESPVRVKPRPTLDHLFEPQVPFRLLSRAPAPTASATASAVESPGTPPADIFDYGGPHAASSKPPRVDASRPRPDKKPKRRFLRLKKSEDPDFGRTLRSPNAFDCERPAPLATPAFSKKNIFDRDFEALFEVSHCPDFAEHVRVITPDSICPSRETEEAAVHIHEEEVQRGEETDLWDSPPEETEEKKVFLRVPPHSAPSTPRPEKKIAPPRVSRLPAPVAKSSSLEEPIRKRAGFFSRIRHRSADSRSRMSGGVQSESVLRDITHPSLNEHLKNHNAVSFKLVKTVSDFTSQLSQMYEQQAGELQMLVASYRKKNGELRKERTSCPSSLFHTWETLLQEVEADSQAHSDVAAALDRHVARPLIERTFHRKLQSRKVFAHRDGCDTIIAKTEEKLTKCRQEYKAAHQAYSQSPSQATMAGYMDGHNSYVQQLHATNGMLDEYNQETLPHLLQELEEIYSDLCNTLSEAVLQGAEVVSSRASEQARRYDGLSAQCRALSGTADLAHLARALPTPTNNRPPRRPFAPPTVTLPNRNHHDGAEIDPADAISLENQPPQLKDELILERLGPMQMRSSYDSLKKEALDLEIQIKQLQDSLDSMVRMQQRSLEGHLYNKVNELQEDISMKKFDLRVAQIHLSAVKAQKELFAAKADAGNVDRKLSSTSAGSMKNKWLKAFKSLKPAQHTPPSQPAQPTQPIDKKNGGRDMSRSGAELETHNFLEYTYKKITPCDVCSQVLRGHTRQGLRCRMCKMNVHSDCLGSAGRCQTKSRLLRRQKSTSEIEARIQDQALDEENPDGWLPGQRLIRELSFGEQDEFIDEIPEVDATYQVLKHANEMSRPGAESRAANQNRAPASLAVQAPHIASSSDAARSTHDSGVRRRLFAGMKSFSVFGSRSRNNSPQHRSISLPESAGVTMKTSVSALMLRQSDSSSPIAAPHSPRRQKLNLRMKSLSLDSPESSEQRRRPAGRLDGAPAPASVQITAHSTAHARLHCANTDLILHGRSSHTLRHRSLTKSKSTPSSPVHNRRLLSARNMRMSSVELPDDHDKSLSSASTSPCPSPVKQKPHRLLPTNLYVILYNFNSRHQDELDLKAGYKVTVIDTSDQDWWKGKCLGRVGYFPSKYCTKLQAGERPLQVTHNLQVSDGDNGLMLLRDQIVIQVGEEVDGMVMIRSGDNRQGVCPLKFLQEV